MAPAFTDFQFSTLSEGGALFASALRHLQTLYPGAYTWESTYTIVSLGPDYKGYMELEAEMHIDLFPLGWEPECREEDDTSPDWVHERK